MNIAFLYPAFENLGIEYISAVLKKNGHNTYLLFDPQLFRDLFLNVNSLGKLFSYKKDIIKRIKKQPPDIVAFSVVSDNFSWACSYADIIKRELPEIKIVFGGPHVTAVPQEVLNNWFVDFVIVGEGEYPMLELVNALAQKEPYAAIKNLGYKDNDNVIINDCRPLIQDLDQLPFPDTDLFIEANPYAKKEYNIITSRGCVNKCSYCHNSTERRVLWKQCGKFLRRRSVDNVISELKQRKDKYGFDTLCIWDEVFTYDDVWLTDFCQLYKREIGVPFWTFVHPKHISEKTVELLEKMGCWEVEMGVQTLNQDIKNTMLHRYETKDEVIRAIDLFKKSKIRLVVDVIFGLPGIISEDYVELIETFNEHRPTKIQTFWLRYYPGTDIIPLAKEKKYINDDEIAGINAGIPSRAAASGGSKIYKEFQKYQTILTLLPYMKKGKVDKIIRKCRNGEKIHLPAISSCGHLFTRILDLKNKNDIGGRRYKGRMLFFIKKKIKISRR